MLKCSKEEIKRNLLGSLEIALLMNGAEKRFGDTPDEAIRSFVVPALLFPVTMLGIFMFPTAEMQGQSQNTITMLYSLRFAASWALYFGCVYWLVQRCERKERFCKFVIASNWIAVPATVILLPVIWLLMTGRYTTDDLYAFTVCLMLYTYGFTAFMAGRVLRVPWEMAGFITIISLAIHDYTGQVISFVGAAL